MATRIEVSIPELRNAASKITRAASEYQNAANNLKAAADDLSSAWVGESQKAFVAEQSQAYEWYKKMSALCVEYANSMNTAAQNYEETDSAAAALIRG